MFIIGFLNTKIWHSRAWIRWRLWIISWWRWYCNARWSDCDRWDRVRTRRWMVCWCRRSRGVMPATRRSTTVSRWCAAIAASSVRRCWSCMAASTSTSSCWRSVWVCCVHWAENKNVRLDLHYEPKKSSIFWDGIYLWEVCLCLGRDRRSSSDPQMWLQKWQGSPMQPIGEVTVACFSYSPLPSAFKRL